MPPYICASPTESASAPPRRFAPNAVRPSFVEPTVTRAADRRMSRSVVDSEFRSNSCRFQSRAPLASRRKVEMYGVKSSAPAASVACSVWRPLLA